MPDGDGRKYSSKWTTAAERFRPGAKCPLLLPSRNKGSPINEQLCGTHYTVVVRVHRSNERACPDLAQPNLTTYMCMFAFVRAFRWFGVERVVYFGEVTGEGGGYASRGKMYALK